MGKTLALFWNRFHLFLSFWVKNAKNPLFKEKMDLSVVLKKEVYVVTNWSTRLKNTKLMKFCLC